MQAALAVLALLALRDASALTFKRTPQATILTYSADSRASYALSLRVQADGYIGDFCVVFTALSLAPVPAAPASPPVWELWKPSVGPTSRLAADGNPSGADQVLSGNFPVGSKPSARLDFDFIVYLDTAPMPPPGTYVLSLRADLHPTAYQPSGTPADSAILSISFVVPQVLDVAVLQPMEAFSPSTTSQTLSFGILSAGVARSVDLMARTNAAWSLSLSSANGWALANTADGSKIGYGVALSGSPIVTVPGSPLLLVSTAQPTYAALQRLPLTFTIGSLGLLPTEGTYVDTITVTISAP
jgi:hypothetical protein